MKCAYTLCNNIAIIQGIDPNPTDTASACFEHLWIFRNNDGSYQKNKRYNLIPIKKICINPVNIEFSEHYENNTETDALIDHIIENGIKESIIICEIKYTKWWQKLGKILGQLPKYYCIDGNKRLDAAFELSIDYLNCDVVNINEEELKEYYKMIGKNYV